MSAHGQSFGCGCSGLGVDAPPGPEPAPAIGPSMLGMSPVATQGTIAVSFILLCGVIGAWITSRTGYDHGKSWLRCRAANISEGIVSD